MKESHINSCKAKIEERVNWGPSENWTNQDYELLSEEILKKTGVSLSLTTLKRIWGKVDYQSKPSISTLNALAQYLDFAHWRDFQNNQKSPAKEISIQNNIANNISIKKYINQKSVLMLVILIALSSLYFFIDRRQVFYNLEEVNFTSRIVSNGLPNTVVFNYDVSTVIADSFYIQQSWDRRRRVQILPGDSMHTSFYYYPGYFHAKLIANDQIIKEHEVFIESQGWAGLIERFPEPVYMSNFLQKPNGYLAMDIDQVLPSEEIIQNKDFWIDYYYINDFGDVDANNFEYQCRIRNNSDRGSICHESRISVVCTQGRYNIPLSIPGCIGNLNLTLGNSFFNGKKHDLSPLGCNLSEWVNFKLYVKDGNCDIFINGEKVFSESYIGDLGRIVGFKFKFNGVGEVDMLRLIDQDKTIVFEDNFDENL